MLDDDELDELVIHHLVDVVDDETDDHLHEAMLLHIEADDEVDDHDEVDVDVNEL